jgi:hypothetical protein
MELIHIRHLMAIMLVTSPLARAQGTFQNLDFEDANTTAFTPPRLIPAADAFPAWEALVGGMQVSSVGYESPTLYAAGLNLVGSQEAIQGNYSAVLESSPDGGTASLAHTGVIPSGTESIQLDAVEENAGNFWVEINGNQVNMFPLQPNAGSTPYGAYTLYGGNVSAWAGQSATLSIIQLVPTQSGGQFVPSFLELDDISFSPQAVPEPNALALTGLGALLFGLYRRLTVKWR